MHIIGRGRYAGETYAQRPGVGGGDGSIEPLSRQRFIDGDTTQLGLDGSASDPFATIAQFMASRPVTSIAEASANYVGWVMPALNAYPVAVAFPPYVSTELRADSTSANATGTNIVGNVTWVNVAGPFAATPAIASVHNISVLGSFIVTDDVGAPQSVVVFGGDEVGLQAVQLTGGFDSSTTTELATAAFHNALISGGINAGPNVILLISNSTVNGNVTGESIATDNSIFSSSGITLDAESSFTNCRFNEATVLTSATARVLFDGPSWLSFMEAGGTRGVGTVVLVVGGYNGGGVEGAALPTGAGPTTVSLNGGGASVGYTAEDSGNHYSVTGLADNSIVRLVVNGALEGDTLLITKTDLAAFTLTVQNSATVTIAVIPASERGFVLAQFVGADWIFAAGGSLAA